MEDNEWREISKDQCNEIIKQLGHSFVIVHWESFGESSVGYVGGEPLLRLITYSETTCEINQKTVERFIDIWTRIKSI